MTAGPASALLPPTPSRPWTLRVQEGGYVNRSGRVTACRLLYHWPNTDVEYLGGPVPQQTLEGGTVSVTIPSGVVGVGPEIPGTGLRFGPNPANAGSEIRFVREGEGPSEISIFDLGGRRMARVLLAPAGDSASGVWAALDARGRPLAPGLYVARLTWRG